MPKLQVFLFSDMYPVRFLLLITTILPTVLYRLVLDHGTCNNIYQQMIMERALMGALELVWKLQWSTLAAKPLQFRMDSIALFVNCLLR